MLVTLFASLCGCASSTVRRAPCFDGWTTDSSGASKIKRLSQAERTDLSQMTPQGQAIVCVHEMPSGELIIISRGRRLETTQVARDSAGYRVVERGTII